MSRCRTIAFAVAAAGLAVGAAGCSSSSDTSTTSSTVAPGTTAGPAGTTTSTASNAATIKFDKEVQAELKKVGCYTGNIDGIIGPETDAAIIAFQTASGIKVDGQLGPQTDSTLEKDAAAGTIVCKSAGTTTTTAASTTTTKAGGVAPCTATAITEGLGVATHSVILDSYLCSGNYAAGTQAATPPGFVLESTNGVWVQIFPCGTASAGLPPIILETGCAATPPADK